MQKGHPKKSWWNCVEEDMMLMKSFRMFCEDAEEKND